MRPFIWKGVGDKLLSHAITVTISSGDAFVVTFHIAQGANYDFCMNVYVTVKHVVASTVHNCAYWLITFYIIFSRG